MQFKNCAFLLVNKTSGMTKINEHIHAHTVEGLICSSHSYSFSYSIVVGDVPEVSASSLIRTKQNKRRHKMVVG